MYHETSAAGDQSLLPQFVEKGWEECCNGGFGRVGVTGLPLLLPPGITLAQWDAVKHLPGVNVAAPIAVVGSLATGPTYEGLRDRTGHLPAQLSGGEQQRVSIARGLVNHPTLLLADEPTGNLDEESTEEVVRLIRELSAQLGLTLLVVTHDPILARTFDEVVRLRHGRLEPDVRA